MSSVSFARTFQSTGAFSFKINKSSKINIGLYAIAASGEALSHANAAVYLQFTGSAINISAGRTSGTPQKWYSVSSSLPSSTDILDITVIYNNTTNDTEYGNQVGLAAKNAHIFINGTAIMDGDDPKGFYINGNTIGHFRLAYAAAGTACVDDIKIYDALPTAGTTYTVTWMSNGVQVSQTTNVSSGSAVTPPTINPLPCGDKLMGWTDATNGAYVHGTSNLETGATITITGDKTYYAVFADEE